MQVALGVAVGLLASSDQSAPQVLKVAILAEKYAVDYTWYVDTILNLIRIAGDYVSEEVWYRVIQIVINRDDVQGYAAKTVFEVRPGPQGGEGGVSLRWWCPGSWEQRGRVLAEILISWLSEV